MRPGPIQGGMVHPYLRLRANPLEVTYPAIRLGLWLVSGLSEKTVDRILAARARGPFATVEDLCLRAQLLFRSDDVLSFRSG